jgi:hypothetical protein
VLDQNCHAVSTCYRCGAVLCSMPGCSATCSACGQACCTKDRRTYADGEVYCTRCIPIRWWRLWWGIK